MSQIDIQERIRNQMDYYCNTPSMFSSRAQSTLYSRNLHSRAHSLKQLQFKQDDFIRQDNNSNYQTLNSEQKSLRNKDNFKQFQNELSQNKNDLQENLEESDKSQHEKIQIPVPHFITQTIQSQFETPSTLEEYFGIKKLNQKEFKFKRIEITTDQDDDLQVTEQEPQKRWAQTTVGGKRSDLKKSFNLSQNKYFEKQQRQVQQFEEKNEGLWFHGFLIYKSYQLSENNYKNMKEIQRINMEENKFYHKEEWQDNLERDFLNLEDFNKKGLLDLIEKLDEVQKFRKNKKILSQNLGEVIELVQKCKNHYLVIYMILKCCKILIQLQQLEKALRFLRNLKKYHLQFMSVRIRYKIMKYYSICFTELGHYDTSLCYLRKMVQVSWFTENKKYEFDCYKKLSLLYFLLGDLMSSSYYYKRFSQGELENKNSQLRKLVLTSVNQKIEQRIKAKQKQKQGLSEREGGEKKQKKSKARQGNQDDQENSLYEDSSDDDFGQIQIIPEPPLDYKQDFFKIKKVSPFMRVDVTKLQILKAKANKNIHQPRQINSLQYFKTLQMKQAENQNVAAVNTQQIGEIKQPVFISHLSMLRNQDIFQRIKRRQDIVQGKLVKSIQKNNVNPTSYSEANDLQYHLNQVPIDYWQVQENNSIARTIKQIISNLEVYKEFVQKKLSYEEFQKNILTPKQNQQLQEFMELTQQ